MSSGPNPRWHNWSGRLRAQPKQLHFLRSEADASALLRDAAQQGRCVRATGAGHSHAPLVTNDAGVIVDCSGLSGVIEVNREQRTGRVWAGTPIYALGRPLHDVGLALHNQGDIDRQSLAGAIATGTHGSGARLGNLSSAVLGVTLIDASGTQRQCSATQEPDLFQAIRLNLGALGLVTQVQLQLRDSYRLEEHSWQAPLAEILAQLPELIDAHRHFEFFWYPNSDQAHAKYMDETPAEAEYPLAVEGQRRAQNYEVLPNHRPHAHTEMEYSVPADAGPECMAAIAQLLRSEHPDVAWPVEYRTLAADDVWLSTAYKQNCVTISVHQDVNKDERAYYRDCEEIFLHYGGRPHWGKVHYLTGTQLRQCHPRWDDWWAIRNKTDPDGVFLNEYLRGWQQA
ncbi:MAG: D-arabinono-1,4-lactone oxidase [Pseudomonadales bacterium]